MDKNSQNYRQAELDLYLTMHDPNANWFSSMLIRLIMKADMKNRAKLSTIYPEYVDVVNKYQNENGYWENLVNSLKNKNR